jgi:hypothetical protein
MHSYYTAADLAFTQSFDLCNSCKDSLEEWMNKMLFRMAEQNREEKDNAD